MKKWWKLLLRIAIAILTVVVEHGFTAYA